MNSAALPSTISTQPWHLPARGLALFEGDSDVPRLSHYFLPGLILKGKRILFLDGANCANPRLMARLAQRRGIPFPDFSRQIQIARAFTCFQLTELIARVPRLIVESSSQILVVTAFPELYFDQDIRDWDARAAFEQALRYLRRWAFQSEPSLAVAVFSASSHFAPPGARKDFLHHTRAAATELWKFETSLDGRLTLLQQPQPNGRTGVEQIGAAAVRHSAR